MYSWEIEQLLKVKNFLLSNKEYFKLFDTSPQICGIEYKPDEGVFYMWTDDNYTFRFNVYNDDKEKGKKL